MSPPGATGGGSKVGTGEYDPEKQKQVFMRMMVAQLEHQDPLNPTKGTEFTAQLAQFTGVEQQIRSNEHLDKLAGKREDQQQWNAMSLLGREVVLDRNSLNLGDSPGKQQFRFQVDEPAQVSARVTDSRGNVVKEIDLGKREAGSHQASWDGTNSDGKPVSGGEYTIQAVPARGDGAPYQTRVQTTVQEVNMGDKGVQLGIGQGEKVPFDRVQTVSR
jgi:flagellar basal-body rod modification protein FlgD